MREKELLVTSNIIWTMNKVPHNYNRTRSCRNTTMNNFQTLKVCYLLYMFLVRGQHPLWRSVNSLWLWVEWYLEQVKIQNSTFTDWILYSMFISVNQFQSIIYLLATTNVATANCNVVDNETATSILERDFNRFLQSSRTRLSLHPS